MKKGEDEKYLRHKKSSNPGKEKQIVFPGKHHEKVANPGERKSTQHHPSVWGFTAVDHKVKGNPEEDKRFADILIQTFPGPGAIKLKSNE
jgi:hypothetical protein